MDQVVVVMVMVGVAVMISVSSHSRRLYCWCMGWTILTFVPANEIAPTSCSANESGPHNRTWQIVEAIHWLTGRGHFWCLHMLPSIYLPELPLRTFNGGQSGYAYLPADTWNFWGRGSRDTLIFFVLRDFKGGGLNETPCKMIDWSLIVFQR